jgi:RND superfamily putative drug exporter
MINVRQFGIGVAVAVLLDILLVRPVLLPAAEAVLGRFGWWPTKPPADEALALPDDDTPIRTESTIVEPRVPLGV